VEGEHACATLTGKLKQGDFSFLMPPLPDASYLVALSIHLPPLKAAVMVGVKRFAPRGAGTSGPRRAQSGSLPPPPRAPQLLHHHARDGEAAVPQVRSDLPPVGRRQRQGRGAHHGGGLPDPGGRPAVGGRRFAEELGFSKNATFPPPGPSPPPYTHTRVASPCRQTLSVPPSLEIPPVGLRMLCALYQELS